MMVIPPLFGGSIVELGVLRVPRTIVEWIGFFCSLPLFRIRRGIRPVIRHGTASERCSGLIMLIVMGPACLVALFLLRDGISYHIDIRSYHYLSVRSRGSGSVRGRLALSSPMRERKGGTGIFSGGATRAGLQ